MASSVQEASSSAAVSAASAKQVDMKFEIVVIPVSDVDRAKKFYRQLGFREDIDANGPDGFRVVQLTPPGSACSIIFGVSSSKDDHAAGMCGIATVSAHARRCAP